MNNVSLVSSCHFSWTADACVLLLSLTRRCSLRHLQMKQKKHAKRRWGKKKQFVKNLLACAHVCARFVKFFFCRQNVQLLKPHLMSDDIEFNFYLIKIKNQNNIQWQTANHVTEWIIKYLSKHFFHHSFLLFSSINSCDHFDQSIQWHSDTS